MTPPADNYPFHYSPPDYRFQPDWKDRLLLFIYILIIILLAGWFILGCPRKARAQDIVTIAQAEIGNGEQGANNHGPHVKKYLNGKEDLPWCAGFVSYCIKKSGLNLRYTLRAKDYLAMGKRVIKPMPGDLIVFSRKGGGHVGIIEIVTEDKIIAIEGNTGEFPSVVKRITYKRDNIGNLLGFVRLARYAGVKERKK